MSKSTSTTNGERFATIRGVRPTHESYVDNLAMEPRHPLLVALISVKDPGGSYWMMSLVLVASRLLNYVDIWEWDRTTATIAKTRVLCAVQVKRKCSISTIYITTY